MTARSARIVMIQTRRLFMRMVVCCEPAAISTKILQVVPERPPFLVHRGQAVTPNGLSMRCRPDGIVSGRC